MKRTTIYFLTVMPIQFLWCAKKDRIPLIFGGRYGEISEYPHSVFLYGICEVYSTCGASILNQRILLTAAHCVDWCQLKKSSHSVTAYMGATNLTHAKIVRDIKEIIIHVDYNINLDSDIALVKTNKSIPFGRNVKRVIIPRTFPDISDSFAFVAGWGRADNEPYGGISNHLRQVLQILRKYETCTKFEYAHCMTGKFCAGNLKIQNNYPTTGDSGGALVTKTKRYIQIGIVSYSKLGFDALTFYTNVTYYYSWIDEAAKILYCG